MSKTHQAMASMSSTGRPWLKKTIIEAQKYVQETSERRGVVPATRPVYVRLHKVEQVSL